MPQFEINTMYTFGDNAILDHRTTDSILYEQIKQCFDLCVCQVLIGCTYGNIVSIGKLTLYPAMKTSLKQTIKKKLKANFSHSPRNKQNWYEINQIIVSTFLYFLIQICKFA